MILQNIALLPVSILQIVFAALMSFVAILIWKQARYPRLALFFIFQAVLSAMNVLEETNLSKQTYLITPAFTLVIGPILYFFIRSLVNEVPLKGFKKWGHFILAFLALPFTEFTQLIIGFGTLSQIIYITLCFQLLARYHRASKAVSSDANSYKLTWLVKALIVFTLFTLVDLIRMNLQTITPDFIKGLWYLANEIIFFSIYSFLGFKVILQPTLFDGMTAYESLEEHQGLENKQQEEALATKIFASIEGEILQKNLFKKPRLTVTELSQVTGLNVKDISWAINLASKRNFCDYINSLRVKYVQKQLLAGDSANLSILEIALASGFNSKSSFNSAFKKELNQTPTEFVAENCFQKNIS